jgi:hypothetical protein
VKVATLEMQGRRAGSVVLKTGPAAGGYGIAVLNRLGVLDMRQIKFGCARLQLIGGVPSTHRERKANGAPPSSFPGGP